LVGLLGLGLSFGACGDHGDGAATGDGGAAAVDGGAATTGDSGSMDSGSMDSGSMDSGSMDGGSMDSGSMDGGSMDSGSMDSGSTDGGSADGGSVDTGSADGGAADLVTRVVLSGSGSGRGAGGSANLATTDLDGDGVVDLAVGAPASGDSTVWVVSLSPAPAASALLDDVAWAAVDGDAMGWLSVQQGDSDSDGIGDLVVGSGVSLDPTVGGPGQAMLFSGGSALADASGSSDAHAVVSSVWDDMIRMTSLGDVDGDGVADMVVGAALANDAHWEWGNAGGVAIFLGGHATGAPVLGDADEVAYGTYFAVDLGASVAVSDTDGDGYGDVLAGAPGWSDGTGEVFVLRGRTPVRWAHDMASAAAVTIQGGAGVSALGADPFCRPVDMDADGQVDLVLSSSATGRVWGFHDLPGRGSLSTSDADVVVAGDADSFGASVACDGDFNGDGQGDLVIGDPEHGDAGTVWIMGAPFAPSMTGVLDPADALATAEGAAAGDRFGASVAVLPDLDGDGRPDVAVGAPGLDHGDTDVGGVVLLGWE